MQSLITEKKNVNELLMIILTNSIVRCRCYSTTDLEVQSESQLCALYTIVKFLVELHAIIERSKRTRDRDQPIGYR